LSIKFILKYYYWNLDDRNIIIGINYIFARSNSLSDIDKKNSYKKLSKKTYLCRVFGKGF